MVFTGSRVSVVDDDESMREALPDLLKELGFSVNAFSSAREFLESAAAGVSDCLIVDVAMPGMTGPDLQRELRRRRKQVPIIFITARKDDTARTKLLAEGAVECLFKPFSEAELLAALKAALRVS